MRLPGQLIKSNAQNVNDLFDIVEMGLKPFLADDTSAENRVNPDDLVKDSPLAWILDNPIMKIMRQLNPISILVEAASETFSEAGLDDDFQVPNVASYLSPVARTLWEAFKSIIGQFVDLLKGLGSDIAACANDPSKAMKIIKKALQKAFRFLFNTVKTIAATAWTVVGEIMDAVVEFVEAKWKIPLVTTLFTWYAEQVRAACSTTALTAGPRDLLASDSRCCAGLYVHQSGYVHGGPALRHHRGRRQGRRTHRSRC
jgi:hypothetical protein